MPYDFLVKEAHALVDSIPAEKMEKFIIYIKNFGWKDEKRPTDTKNKLIELMGSCKGLWNEDAQEYVSKSRAEREF